jgi:AmmeMemoRadiSam system protein B
MSVRLPCQAGQFYAGDANHLRKQIEECFTHRLGAGRLPPTIESPLSNLVGLVSPHAGYMFSGPVAANGFYFAASCGRPDSVVILGPNHTGVGSGISIMTKGMWRTPLGDVEIDSELAKSIQTSSQLIDIDDSAHRYEHSIEVQLPFLQYIYGSRFRFVPICMMLQDLTSSRDIGETIAKACRGKNILVIASTDLTHYQPQRIAEAKDKLVIDAILRVDEKALQEAVESHNISMCGFGPVSAAIVASKDLGASHAERLSYHTSGDLSGDYTQVVGYCSVALTRG